MVERFGVYKCNICGNVVRVNLAGVGNLVCCGQPMVLQRPKVQEEGHEKHLPVVEETPQGVRVKVGSVPHPMEANHYVVWVEVEADGHCLQRFFKPGDRPEAEFLLGAGLKPRVVREYCNVHGLWERELRE